MILRPTDLPSPSNRRFIPAGLLSLGLVVVFGLVCTIFYGQIVRSNPSGAADFPTPETAVAIPATERVALTVSTTRALNIPPAPPNVSVYFVPIGNLSIIDVSYLVEYYRQRLGLSITPLPAIALGRTYDPRRRQNQAEALLQSMRDEYAKIANDGRSILIGITEADIYTSDRNWRFALGLRDEGRFAVVSSARMDLDHVNYGAPSDFVGLHTRLTKMISREIGFMYYRLRTSRDPRSVVRSSIMGVDELDELGEDF